MKKLALAGVFNLSLLILSYTVFADPSSSGAAEYSGGDPSMRLQQLEDEIRHLNGRIEEIGFQLLQMQENVRKAQQDSEFRFQEFEKKLMEQKGKTSMKSIPVKGDNSQAKGPASKNSASLSNSSATRSSSPVGAPPSKLGSIRFDAEGNPIDYTADKYPASTNSGDHDDLYEIAYSYLLAHNYIEAEQQFRKYLSEYSEGPNSANATFFLGEALLAQKKYKDAAKIFLAGQQTYSNAERAPEMLLKLGISLVFLGNKEAACSTFKAIPEKYPKASDAIKNKVIFEQKRLSC